MAKDGEDAPELDGAAEVFGVETPSGEGRRGVDERDAEDEAREAEHRKWKRKEREKAQAEWRQGVEQRDAEDEEREVAHRAAARDAAQAHMGDFEKATRETNPQAGETAIDDAIDLDKDVKWQGCTPRVLAGIAAASIIALILVITTMMGGDDKPKKCTTMGVGTGEVALPAGGDCPDGEAAPADPNATVYSGSSGGPVGCVPCDGDARFLAITSPPGPGSFPGAAGKGQADVELGPGTLQNLRVEVSGADRGRWSASLGANFGCTLEPGDTSCVAAGPLELTEATLVSLIIGNDGDPQLYAVNDDGTVATYGDGTLFVKPDSEKDGVFTMTFTFEFIPA